MNSLSPFNSFNKIVDILRQVEPKERLEIIDSVRKYYDVPGTRRGPSWLSEELKGKLWAGNYP